MLSTFAQKLKSAGGQEHYLVKGFDFTGGECWFRVKVRKAVAAQFEAAIARGELTNLAEHGEIVQSGYGPPPEDLAQSVA